MKKREKLPTSLEGEWTGKELKIMYMLADPNRKSQRELAAELAGLADKPREAWTRDDLRHVHSKEQYIYRLKRKPGFLGDVLKLASKLYIDFHLKIDYALYKAACREPVDNPALQRAITEAQRLYYQRHGLLDKKDVQDDEPVHIVIRGPDGRVKYGG